MTNLVTSLKAKAREGKKDAVHLVEDGDVLCDRWLSPSSDFTSEEWRVDPVEVLDEEYLVRDGEIKGKLCGRCLGIVDKANRFPSHKVEVEDE